MYSTKTIGKFIEWAQPSLKKLHINMLTIQLKRLIHPMIYIDLPIRFNKQFVNFVELRENDEVEMLFHICFEDGISLCSINTLFKKNEYKSKKKFILGNFRGRRFSNPDTSPELKAKYVQEWVKKTEDAVKQIIALLNDYIKE